MKSRVFTVLLVLGLAGIALPQNQNSQPNQEPVIKIGTDLVQIDAVVLDKNGNVVRGLTKDDFEVSESGKRQHLSFFEFVDAGKGLRIAREAAPETAPGKTPPISTQGVGEAQVRRIFAFVVDDLTIRPSDLTYVRQMLTHFVDSQMEPSDLVGIVRTVGGADLLQQFTSNKDILHRAITVLTPRTSAFNAFTQYGSGANSTVASAPQTGTGDIAFTAPSALSGNPIDIDSPNDATNMTLRAYMTLGTASYVIDSMKQLPGRKTMVLISGGIQALGGAGSAPITNGLTQADSSLLGISAPPEVMSPIAGNANLWLETLADKATRAGVAINAMDIRGLSGQTGVPSFEDTPGKSAMGMGNQVGFGRTADESMIGSRNPFDTTAAHQGLRELAAATGGMAVLNRNEFDKGLAEIVDASDGYYLLAYTPTDSKFKGGFRKLEIKVKGGYRVLSRKGYFAREEPKPTGPKTMALQMLEAIQSPVAKLDVGLDMMVLYKGLEKEGAATPGTPEPKNLENRGSVDIELNIDPQKLSFVDSNGKKDASVDVAGFVYDQFGKLRGGFAKKVDLSLTPDEWTKASTDGIPFPTQHTQLPAGVYEIRVGVRDQKTGALGTISRYLEVPDLSKGRLSASTLLLGAVPLGDTKADAKPTPVSGNRRIAKEKDLRYAVIIYNARRKDGHAKVTTQLTIFQDGRVLYREPVQQVTDRGPESALIKIGQLGLSHVKLGRYLLQLEITDENGDKKDRTITRSMDFAVVP